MGPRNLDKSEERLSQRCLDHPLELVRDCLNKCVYLFVLIYKCNLVVEP